jgi:hypothetical protein
MVYVYIDFLLLRGNYNRYIYLVEKKRVLVRVKALMLCCAV